MYARFQGAWPIVAKTAKLAADHIVDRHARNELVSLFDKKQMKQAMIDPHTEEETVPWWEKMFKRTAASAVKSMEESAAGGTLLSKAVINARHAGTGASVAARKRVYGDPRTLYGKGGGVFGLAKLSHTLMEAWMADSTLNANAKVATWHESGQKAGFKFLVTQIMGYQTGGPQKYTLSFCYIAPHMHTARGRRLYPHHPTAPGRYTGRPMDAAHMHLGISQREWGRFIQIAAQTLVAAHVPTGASRELLDILRRCAALSKRRKHRSSDPAGCACW